MMGMVDQERCVEVTSGMKPRYFWAQGVISRCVAYLTGKTEVGMPLCRLARLSYGNLCHR